MQTRTGTVVLAGIAAIAMLVASACSAGTAALSGTFLADRAEATEGAGSAKVEQTVSMRVEAAGRPAQDIEFTATGAIDFANQTGSIAFDMADLGIPGAEGKVEMRFIGTEFFMRFPPGAIPGASGAWVRIDLTEQFEDLGLDPGALTGGAQNPTEMLDMLAEVSGEVTEVGSADVRGTPTTEYAAEIDYQKVFEQFGSNLAPLGAQGEEIRGVLEDLVVPVTVFVDDDGRVRRFEMQMDIGEIAAAGGEATEVAGDMQITQDYLDFGTPVDVRPPPPDATVDFRDFLASVGGGGAGAPQGT